MTRYLVVCTEYVDGQPRAPETWDCANAWDARLRAHALRDRRCPRPFAEGAARFLDSHTYVVETVEVHA